MAAPLRDAVTLAPTANYFKLESFSGRVGHIDPWHGPADKHLSPDADRGQAARHPPHEPPLNAQVPADLDRQKHLQHSTLTPRLVARLQAFRQRKAIFLPNFMTLPHSSSPGQIRSRCTPVLFRKSRQSIQIHSRNTGIRGRSAGGMG
jgi:hypothetical protein